MAKEEKLGLIYAGQRLGSDNKIYHKYVVIGEERSIQFSRRVGTIEIIGNLLECVDKGGDTYNGFKVVGKIEDGEQKYGDVRNWFIEQRAAQEAVRQIKINKQKRPESLEAKIDNLRDDFKYLSTKKKNDLALWIYTQLIK